MKQFNIESLMAGVQTRSKTQEQVALVERWTRSGLLRGLDGNRRTNMAQLLENQFRSLVEAASVSTGGGALTSSGQIQGVSTTTLPIVRRIFGGLVSNELISIQPMSLPSGLIFYLDYSYGSNVGGEAGSGLSNSATFETYQRGQSLYSNPSGRGIQSGSLAAGGMYDLMGAGYTKVHSASSGVSGSNLDIGAWTGASDAWVTGSAIQTVTSFTGTNARMCGYDSQVEVDLQNGTLDVAFVHLSVAAIQSVITKGDFLAVDQIALFAVQSTGGAVAWGESYQSGKGVLNLRRLNKRGDWSAAAGTFTPNPLNGTHVQLVLRLSNGGVVPSMNTATQYVSMAITDALQVDSTSGAVVTIPSFESDFGSTPTPAIPEIEIKIESISITATTRKLRARWSPELSQDLNAYHALDAEVELTSVLSEQIALEIDREILNDLLTQANGAIMYWSRAPGKFVNKLTGAPVNLANTLSIGPQFTGTVREWYETLVETIIDVGNTIHRKTFRGSANFIVIGTDVSTILENSVLYKSKFSIDSEGQVSSPFTIGAEAIGSLSNRFTVYKDPYFPRSKVLVGYKGGSALETGYVYAPYVPLIVTPTIFAPEDMTPRKAVMTRYGKKMIRSDYYGVVNCVDMSII